MGLSCLPREDSFSELYAGIYNHEISDAGSTEAGAKDVPMGHSCLPEQSETRYNISNNNRSVDEEKVAERGSGPARQPP